MIPERPGPPGTVPLILVDGPSAGQIRHIPPSASAWNVPDPYAAVFNPGCPYPSTSAYSTYAVRRYTLCYPADGYDPYAAARLLPLHLGVCGPQEPDEAALLRHIPPALEQLGWVNDSLRAWLTRRIPPQRQPDAPVRIVDPGGECLSHDGTVRISTRGPATIQGVCCCGWLTETVARGAQAREAMDLADAHRAQGNARSAARITAAVETARELQASLPAPRAADERDWAEHGSTCAHVCGPGPDHRCDAKATKTLEFAIPSGGKRRLPLCEPCNASELAATAPGS